MVLAIFFLSADLGLPPSWSMVSDGDLVICIVGWSHVHSDIHSDDHVTCIVVIM